MIWFLSVTVTVKHQVDSANMISIYIISGDFFGSEDCGFYLYPVFADGEGEPMHATGMDQFSGRCLIV